MQYRSFVDTEYDRVKVPPYNGDDPPPAPGSLKAPLIPPLLNEVQNKGTQGVQARYGAELPPIISIVRYLGRPVILGMDFGPCEQEASCIGAKWGCTGAKEGLGGAKDSWATFSPGPKKSKRPVAPSPNFHLSGNFPRSTASQPKHA